MKSDRIIKLEQQVSELTLQVEEMATVLFAVKAMFETVSLCFGEVSKLKGSFLDEVAVGLKIVEGGKS